jgi:hypothetical protein
MLSTSMLSCNPFVIFVPMSSRLSDLIHDRNFFLQLIAATVTDNPEAYWDQDDQDELDLQDHPPKFTRVREKRRFSVDYSQTEWGQLIRDPEVKNPYSKKGKLFRRRFRVPYCLFAWICTKCKEHNVFEVKREASVEIPTTIKVAISLRMLGRAECADTLRELSSVSEPHVRIIFIQFVKNFRLKLEKDFIYAPQGEELQAIMDEYSSLGLPGTVGSVDVTHVYLDKCPAHLSNLCTGKEKKPTLAFEVVVSHRKKVLSVSKGEYGSLNDKTICKMDPFVADIMHGRIYKDVESTIYSKDGTEKVIVKGAHLICDGGYHKIPAMICPMSFRTDMKEVFWSEWVESVRKDVECTFGILKKRFTILKNPFQGHDLDLLDDVFVICCMLHNMLLIVDGGSYNWLRGIRVECEPDSDSEPEDDDQAAIKDIAVGESYLPKNAVLDDMSVNGQTLKAYDIQPLPNNGAWIQFHSKVKMMVNHFAHSYNTGTLKWMRTSSDGSKQFYPVGNSILGSKDPVQRVLIRSFPAVNDRNRAIASLQNKLN